MAQSAGGRASESNSGLPKGSLTSSALHDITGTSRFFQAWRAISGNLANSRLLSQQGLSINVYPEYLCPKKAEILPAHGNVQKIDSEPFLLY
jgi:hypothetical protein